MVEGGDLWYRMVVRHRW